MPDFDSRHRQLSASVAKFSEAARYLGGGRTMALQISPDQAWHYSSDGEQLVVEPGLGEAQLIVGITAQAFEQLASGEFSLAGLMYSSNITLLKGDFNLLMLWEPALQALYWGWPIWTPAVGASLDDLDLHQGFEFRRLEAGSQAATDFMQRTGFLHIREVFSPQEVAAMRDECEVQKALATPDDGRSWWATRASGEEVCCRVTYLNRSSDLIRGLPADPRILRIAALPQQQLLWSGDSMDGANLVAKVSDVVEGLSDLPWHRDCGTGGHHLICPGIILGIQLDVASAGNGQLKFLAGSSEHANPAIDDSDPDLPIVAVDCQPGDVTIHYCHTMHIAPPPTDVAANRRVLYFAFFQQKLLDAIPSGKSYNDLLFSGDGRIRAPEPKILA
jgi:hypothetical protein